MANFMYSKLSGKNDPMFGKYEHSIMALIENESNAQQKKKSSLDYLYNVQKSKRHSESVMGQSDFDTFMKKEEGQRAENDNVEKTYDKTIEHVTFAKEFTITREMADDAMFGIGANMKAKPEGFVRAYYKTRTMLGAKALANATNPTLSYNNAKIDLTTGDKLPLFYNKHPYFTDKMKGKTQSNYFYGEFTTGAQAFEEALGVLSNQLRNFEDENGEVMEYIADTIIIPTNRPLFEMMVKKVVGTERTAGNDYNDINVQYGNWNIVMLEGWRTDRDEFMLMSSEANKNLLGNMFFDRTKLDIRNRIDDSTRNYIWNGYCRMGLGYTTWKHMLRAVSSAETVANATKL